MTPLRFCGVLCDLLDVWQPGRCGRLAEPLPRGSGRARGPPPGSLVDAAGRSATLPRWISSALLGGREDGLGAFRTSRPRRCLRARLQCAFGARLALDRVMHSMHFAFDHIDRRPQRHRHDHELDDRAATMSSSTRSAASVVRSRREAESRGAAAPALHQHCIGHAAALGEERGNVADGGELYAVVCGGAVAHARDGGTPRATLAGYGRGTYTARARPARSIASPVLASAGGSSAMGAGVSRHDARLHFRQDGRTLSSRCAPPRETGTG